MSITIATTLQQDILEGRLLPGTLLQQEALAEQFQVSRHPIRGALEILRAKGLVRIRPDRRVEVAALADEVFKDIVAIRLLLEPPLLRIAVPKLSPMDLLSAQQIQERMELEPDPNRLRMLDIAFHIALYKPCANERALALVEQLRTEHQRAYLGQPPDSDARGGWNDDHRELLDTCRQKKTKKAESILTRHIEKSGELLR